MFPLTAGHRGGTRDFASQLHMMTFILQGPCGTSSHVGDPPCEAAVQTRLRTTLPPSLSPCLLVLLTYLMTSSGVVPQNRPYPSQDVPQMPGEY